MMVRTRKIVYEKEVLLLRARGECVGFGDRGVRTLSLTDAQRGGGEIFFFFLEVLGISAYAAFDSLSLSHIEASHEAAKACS